MTARLTAGESPPPSPSPPPVPAPRFSRQAATSAAQVLSNPPPTCGTAVALRPPSPCFQAHLSAVEVFCLPLTGALQAALLLAKMAALLRAGALRGALRLLGTSDNLNAARGAYDAAAAWMRPLASAVDVPSVFLPPTREDRPCEAAATLLVFVHLLTIGWFLYVDGQRSLARWQRGTCEEYHQGCGQECSASAAPDLPFLPATRDGLDVRTNMGSDVEEPEEGGQLTQQTIEFHLRRLDGSVAWLRLDGLLGMMPMVCLHALSLCTVACTAWLLAHVLTSDQLVRGICSADMCTIIPA